MNFDELSDLQGFEIHTTLNKSIADVALSTSKKQVELLEDKHKLTNAAVVVLSPNDSAILAMIGSVDYFDKRIDGAVNVATSLRQPGSAIKPFTYGEAFFEEKLKPNDIILDEKTTFIDKSGNSFIPYNYNGKFNGPVTARVALASSLNLPAVKVLDLIGVESMIKAAQKAGIKTLDNPDKYDLSVTLGGGEVTLLDLTNAYNSLARNGAYKKVYSVSKIVNAKGVVVYEHQSVSSDPIWGEKSEAVSEVVTDILSSPEDKVLGFGRDNVLVLPFKAAAKTGTTTDWHDNWTFGYTSDFTVGVWVGNADNRPMYAITGVTGAGPIWREIMEYCYSVLTYTELPQEKKAVIIEDEKLPATKSEKKLAITNPAEKSEYYLNPSQLKFEKILFEVSFTADVDYVEYIVDGNKISTATKKDSFRYNWQPKTGSHEVTAIFKDHTGRMLAEDKISFQVF